jgi:N-dimethylarginine dimethylaminohydrolase
VSRRVTIPSPLEVKTPMTMQATAHILMCRPQYFAVNYAINPWMDPSSWAREARVLAATARREWSALHRALQNADAQIELVPSAPGLPDLVFTANAAVVLDGKALLARFRHPERRAEEPRFAATFRKLQARGVITSVRTLPDDVTLEGAGDCVWDQARNLFWMGYGPRSDEAARHAVAEEFGTEVLALRLADQSFYHMDTALCPLPGGEVMYVPGAFTAEGRAVIHERVPHEQRIELADEDARQLAANAVALGGTLVLYACSESLRGRLAERGYRVHATPLGSFLRSGGSAFCLTLRLDRRSAQDSAQEQRERVGTAA